MYADFSGSEPDTALMEEREALNIQRKMAEQLADEDFGLDIFKAGSHRHYLPLNLFEETIFSGIKGNPLSRNSKSDQCGEVVNHVQMFWNIASGEFIEIWFFNVWLFLSKYCIQNILVNKVS